jgi:pimeloyl-ACP methyl ester carboxylesterase
VDPALAPRLADAVPDARLLVLDRVGHVAMLEAPEPTARAVLGLVDGLDRSTGRDGAVSAPT